MLLKTHFLGYYVATLVKLLQTFWSMTTPQKNQTNIQGEHKNTPWFQVVIKSKLTGIFLQNWWLQLHKLIQFHVVSHTHTHTQCAPFNSRLALRIDFLGLRKKDSLTWSTTCSKTDGRPECPFLWSQMHPLSIKFLCHFKMDLLVGKSTLNLRLKAHCSHNTVCFVKFQHAPAAPFWSERHLAFHCPLAAGGKIKNFLS